MDKNNFSHCESLESVRAKIDDIDSEILSLIEKREHCVIQIANIKKQLSDFPAYYVPERELEIISRVEKNYKGNFAPGVIGGIFQIIIQNCRILQK